MRFLRLQFNSIAQSCPTHCNPMNCSTPGFPVHDQLPESIQTHVHRVGRWCHPTISTSVVPFSSCPQSFPASGSFQMSQLFASGGQSIRVSASTSVLPMNTQDISPLGWTGWISMKSKGLSTLRRSPFFIVQFSHPYMTTGKTIALTRWTLLAVFDVNLFFFLI